MTKARKIPGLFSCAEATADYLSRHLPADGLLYGSGCRAAGPRLDEIVAALRKWRIASGAARSGQFFARHDIGFKKLARGGTRPSRDGIAQIIVSSSFSRKSRSSYPYILISFRNRFLALAPTIN
jgi:hypothetical protein